MPGKEVKKTEITVPRASKRVIRISEVITVAELARSMGVKAGEVLKKLIDMGMMATINQALDHDTATLVAGEFEYQVENIAGDPVQAHEEREHQALRQGVEPRRLEALRRIVEVEGQPPGIIVHELDRAQLGGLEQRLLQLRRIASVPVRVDMLHAADGKAARTVVELAVAPSKERHARLIEGWPAG
jgi:hypothetical protein